jgi:hypothetical protein
MFATIVLAYYRIAPLDERTGAPGYTGGVDFWKEQQMETTDPLERDPQVQQLDAEVARLVARVEQLRVELGQAEEELRAYRAKDMEARRSDNGRA